MVRQLISYRYSPTIAFWARVLPVTSTGLEEVAKTIPYWLAVTVFPETVDPPPGFSTTP